MNRISRWRWPALWALVILALTSIPGSDIPQVSLFPEADKLVHATLYGIFASLIMRVHGARPSRSIAAAVLCGIAIFAAADEWHQQFIPGRSMDVLDWSADVAGSLLGTLFTRIALRRQEHVT